MSTTQGDNEGLGRITYQTPVFQWVSGSQGAINSGFSFDLPLAAVSAFTNNALAFTSANTQNAQGFLGGVISQSQANVNRTMDINTDFNYATMATLERIGANQQAHLTERTRRMTKKKKGCFITTAICERSGKADNCFELETLRKFRDDWLLLREDGLEAVQVYYDIAPAIVESISMRSDADEVYDHLREHYLEPAIDSINDGEFDKAFTIYRRMVEVAQYYGGV